MRSRVAAVCLGIAGVDRPADEQVIRGILRRLGYRETARVVNDAAIALAAGAPERVGIVVLAGTGSIAYGADRAGRTARAGGYGFLLADEGSGYWLGHQALRAAVRAADGRGPQTLLTPARSSRRWTWAPWRAGAARLRARACPSTGSPPWRALVQQASERGRRRWPRR